MTSSSAGNASRDSTARCMTTTSGNFEIGRVRGDLDAMPASLMTQYARICNATLARAHARSGDRVAIAAYLGKGDTFDQAIADFSASYADQNERDYEAVVRAVESGRLEAQSGF